jgi:hypothetical protein
MKLRVEQLMDCVWDFLWDFLLELTLGKGENQLLYIIGINEITIINSNKQ